MQTARAAYRILRIVNDVIVTAEIALRVIVSAATAEAEIAAATWPGHHSISAARTLERKRAP
jgi:hypothetical protein